jgi:hypothetical protein
MLIQKNTSTFLVIIPVHMQKKNRLADYLKDG